MKLDETILNLKTMFPAKDFIVTGSFVLAKYGLVSWDSIADLDIILVNPETSTIELLNRYMKDFPAPSTARLQNIPTPVVKAESKKKSPDYDDDEEEEEDVVKVSVKKQYKDAGAQAVQSKSILQAIFMFDKVKVDVYIENNFSEPTLFVDGIKYTTIPHFIKAKQSYGRMKDWLQCRDMAKILFDGYAFQIMLDGNWKDSLRNDYPDK